MGSVRLSTASIYGLAIGVDDKNPDRYSVNVGQSGLGLPDRDYYLQDEAYKSVVKLIMLRSVVQLYPSPPSNRLSSHYVASPCPGIFRPSLAR
jgi:predicted metalloendopeptidase